MWSDREKKLIVRGEIERGGGREGEKSSDNNTGRNKNKQSINTTLSFDTFRVHRLAVQHCSVSDVIDVIKATTKRARSIKNRKIMY